MKRKSELLAIDYDVKQCMETKSYKENRNFKVSFIFHFTPIECTVYIYPPFRQFKAEPDYPVKSPYFEARWDDRENEEQQLTVKLKEAESFFKTLRQCGRCTAYQSSGDGALCVQCLTSQRISIKTDEPCHMCFEKKKIQFMCVCKGSATCFECVRGWKTSQAVHTMACTLCNGVNESSYVENGKLTLLPKVSANRKK
jgi:hypothetical protein